MPENFKYGEGDDYDKALLLPLLMKIKSFIRYTTITKQIPIIQNWNGDTALAFLTMSTEQPIKLNIFRSECYNYRILFLSERLFKIHLLNYKNPSTH